MEYVSVVQERSGHNYPEKQLKMLSTLVSRCANFVVQCMACDDLQNPYKINIPRRKIFEKDIAFSYSCLRCIFLHKRNEKNLKHRSREGAIVEQIWSQ